MYRRLLRVPGDREGQLGVSMSVGVKSGFTTMASSSRCVYRSQREGRIDKREGGGVMSV